MAAERKLVIALGIVIVAAGWVWRDEADPAALAERQKLIEQMSPTEKEALLRRHKQFSDLPPAEQERLRKLHRELEMDPDCKSLQDVMARYHDWFKQLSPLQRSELLAMPPEARVKEIQKLRAEEDAFRKRRDEYRLSSEDLDAIAAWLEEQVSAKAATLPEDPRGKEFLGLTPAQRRGALSALLRQRTPGAMRLPEITADDISELQKRLSAEAQAKLAGRATFELQRNLLIEYWSNSGWLWQAMRDAQRKYFDSLLADLPNLDQELVRLFESSPVKERNDLLEKSPEYRQMLLKARYVHKHLADRLPSFMKVPEAGFGQRGPGFPGPLPEGPFTGRRGGGRSGEGPPPGEGRRGEGPPPRAPGVTPAPNSGPEQP